MGQAKNKQRNAFAQQLIEKWEADDCVNFAVGLARMTGWLLHVDWWSSVEDMGNTSHDHLKPLRVYVADNRDHVFDVRGVKTINEFSERTIIKLAHKVATGYGGVLTRYYGEERLASLPLRCQPDEIKITEAIDAIHANLPFLALIPTRPPASIPAYQAARYTFGRCAAFAQALHLHTGLPPVALLARKFTPLFGGTKLNENGYVHSVVMHPDGAAEDVWGKAPVTEIAGRFGVIEFEISADEHRRVVENIRRSSAEIYESDFQTALELIKAHRTEPQDAV